MIQLDRLKASSVLTSNRPSFICNKNSKWSSSVNSDKKMFLTPCSLVSSKTIIPPGTASGTFARSIWFFSLLRWELRLRPALILRLSTRYRLYPRGISVRLRCLSIEQECYTDDAWLDFGSPTGNIKNGVPEYAIDPALKGFLGAAYSLGAICALPFIPWVNQRFGRRWTIFIGSIISLIGALIQGFSNGGTYAISLVSALHG